MKIEIVVLVVSSLVSFTTLCVFIWQTRILGAQTRYLGAQTESLIRSQEYASYQKLIDYTNLVSLQLLENEKVIKVFNDIGFIKRGIEGQQLSIEKIGLAWLIINRYEAAFVGHQLGMVPEEEWQVWERRLRKDLQIPFVRDVWVHDVKNYDYNPKYKEIVTRMIMETEQV